MLCQERDEDVRLVQVRKSLAHGCISPVDMNKERSVDQVRWDGGLGASAEAWPDGAGELVSQLISTWRGRGAVRESGGPLAAGRHEEVEPSSALRLRKTGVECFPQAPRSDGGGGVVHVQQLAAPGRSGPHLRVAAAKERLQMPVKHDAAVASPNGTACSVRRQQQPWQMPQPGLQASGSPEGFEEDAVDRRVRAGRTGRASRGRLDRRPRQPPRGVLAQVAGRRAEETSYDATL